jgi:hypothetical protein
MSIKIIADLATGETVAADLSDLERADLQARRDAAPSTQKAQANALVVEQLSAIDAKSVRPLRAVLAAQSAGQAPAPADLARLDDLKAQADALRAALIP